MCLAHESSQQKSDPKDDASDSDGGDDDEKPQLCTLVLSPLGDLQSVT